MRGGSTDRLECMWAYRTNLLIYRFAYGQSGLIGLKRIYPAGFTDRSTELSINQSIVYYVYRAAADLRICIRICGDVHTKRTCGVVSIRIYTTELSYGLCGSVWPRPAFSLVPNRVANRPEFFGTVPNSAAVSRVSNGSIRDRLMSRISLHKQ